ncbi:MAG: hypothetical protein ACYSTZ_11975 [Planctomycetota bacterium]|jgi:uncharacterized protein (UPF0371 family)
MKVGVNLEFARTDNLSATQAMKQTVAIFERADLFRNKLYLEFGGKLLFYNHAAGFFQDLTLTLERYFPAHPIIF